jgi:hypothetical protein
MPVFIYMKSNDFDNHLDVVVASKLFIPEEEYKTLTHEQIADRLRQGYLDGVAEAQADQANAKS